MTTGQMIARKGGYQDGRGKRGTPGQMIEGTEEIPGKMIGR